MSKSNQWNFESRERHLVRLMLSQLVLFLLMGPLSSQAQSPTGEEEIKPPRAPKELELQPRHWEIRSKYNSQKTLKKMSVVDRLNLKNHLEKDFKAKKRRLSPVRKVASPIVDAVPSNSWYLYPGTWESSYITSSYEDHWYEIEVLPGSLSIDVMLVFSDDIGDLDLRIYDSSGFLVESSTSTSDNEYLSVDLDRPGTYYLNVDLFGSIFGSHDFVSYDIRWDEYVDGDDFYEPNNSRAEAFDLTYDEGYWLSNVLGRGIQADQDYFSIDLFGIERQRLTLDLRFVDSDGDIDMELLDYRGYSVISKRSTTDNELIEVDVEPGRYYVRIFYGNRGNRYDFRWTSRPVTSRSRQVGPFSILPSSRSAKVDQTVTVNMTLINNSGRTLNGVGIEEITDIPAIFTFYRLGADLRPIGGPNELIDYLRDGQVVNYLVSVTPKRSFDPVEVEFEAFAEDGSSSLSQALGVDTLLLSGSYTGTPDVIALVATDSNDGVIYTREGTGAFSVATTNVGVYDRITVEPFVSSDHDIDVFVCETYPSSGRCKLSPTRTVEKSMPSGNQATFAVFVNDHGRFVPFDPANNRIFVNFVDSDDIIRGSTSVAITSELDEW